jgi:hypothetical protein
VDVVDPAGERGCFVGPEQPAVVLERGAAAGGIDQDRRIAREGVEDPTGERGGVAVESGVDMQRAAAGGPARVGQCDADAGRGEDSEDGRVHVALPGVHDASGEEPRVVTGAAQRWGVERQRGERDAPGHEMGALGDGEAAREAEEESVVAESAVGEPLPPGDVGRLGGERLACPLHEVPEGHRGRAGHFARSALDAFVHVPGELTAQVGLAGLDGAHGGDAAPRRGRFVAGDPVGRAVRQAQAAGDAGDELLGVDPKRRHDRDPPVRPGPGGGASTGETPGPRVRCTRPL